MFRITLAQVRATLAITAMVMLVSGCGGGVSSGSVGSGGTGIGVTSGFDSLVVDGKRYDDTQASYRSEEDQGPTAAMASTDAMLGHSLEFGYDAGGAMTSVTVTPDLVGTVSSVTVGSITVLGTKVTFNNDTTLGPVTGLAGYASPSSIRVGDRVAVYGLTKTEANGTTFVQATLVIQKPAGTGSRLTGYITQYKANEGTFVIGNNKVNINLAIISPAAATLSNGEFVTVWSNSTPVGNVITATNLRIRWPLTNGGDLRLSGPISGYTGTGNFKVGNVTVDANAASMSPSGASIGENKYVVVVGKFNTATNKLVADSLTVYAPAASDAVGIRGSVQNYVSAASFTVRGVVIDASTARFSGGSSAQLASGAFIEVTGALVNNVVRATTVNILALNPAQSPPGATVDLRGTISAVDASSGAYSLTLASGTTMNGKLSATTFYKNGKASGFVVGQTVNVRGVLNGSTLTTSVVTFNQATESRGNGTIHMEGIAYGVNGGTMMLNGVTIQIPDLSGQGGSGSGTEGSQIVVPAGSRVEVDIQLVGGQYVATAIRVVNN
ncbi:hypothetical protein BH11PSE11_BH11PSE11_36370 [soil metagenome]